MPDQPTREICERCGAPLSPFTAQEMCPNCLLRDGLLANPKSDGLDACAYADVGLSGAVGSPSIGHFGEYELLEEIARGGMGVVYKARHVSLNRIVALKMIVTGRLATDAAVDRFRTEAEAVARLEHPNIVPIYEVGQKDGAHYFTMRLLEGGNLRDAMGGKPMPIMRAAELIATVARGMAYAHSRGVLHRDLKPANVLLDGAGQPHITDFGLAKLAAHEGGLTLSSAVMGTPNYMAPEQALGKSKNVTAAADIYSLGAMLYALLTGRPPFEGGTELEIMRRVVQEEPQRPSTIVPKLNRELETICLKCIEKEPRMRYATAQDLADDLDRWLRHEPIHARPSAHWQRVIKWTQRRPLQATLVLVITVSVVVASLLWFEASRQRAQVVVASNQNALKEIEELFAKKNTPAALARLARLIRDEPANGVAATRLLSALSQQPLAFPEGELVHEDEILSAEYSPDGRWIATASRDGTARIWTSDPARLQHVLSGHDGEVRCARFSPDSQRLMTGGADREARLWDVRTGASLARFTGHESAVRWVDFSPNGQLLLTVASNAVRVWDAGSYKSVARFVAGEAIVRVARFSPDGRMVLTASQDGLVQLWKCDGGKPLHELRHDAVVRSAEFSPDGQAVVTACDDENARIWQWDAGSVTVLPVHGVVSSARFSSDGRRVVTASQSGAVQIWNTQTGAAVGEPMMHRKQVNCACFSRDNLTILSAGDDGAVRLWDALSSEPVSEPILAGQFVNAAEFRPDGRQILSWSSDTRARLWRLPGPPPLTKPLPRAEGVTWVEFSPGAESAVMLSGRSFIRRECQTGRKLGATQMLDVPVQRLHYHPTTESILIVAENIVQVSPLVDVRSPMLTLRHDAPVQDADFSQDGRWIVSLSGKSARVWNAVTGAALHTVFQQEDLLNSGHLTAHGDRLVTASRDSSARIWEIASGRFLSLPHSGSVLAARFSDDGLKVVTATADGAVRIWNSKTGRALSEVLQHPGEVNSAAFSPDGRRIVTSAADRRVRVWDVATGRLLCDALQAGEPVWGARFTSCGRWVVTESGLMWEVPNATGAAPSWLAELAEAVAGQSFMRGNYSPVGMAAISRVKQQLELPTETNAFTCWLKWSFSNPATRTISPSCRMTVADYVEQQISAGTLQSLHEAARLCPTNEQARSELARIWPGDN